MAKSWQYPRWRRTVMQVVLWAVLGAAVATAAAVVRQRSTVAAVPLSDPPATVGPVRFRLPVGWATADVGDGSVGDGRVVVAAAREPTGDGDADPASGGSAGESPARRLEVWDQVVLPPPPTAAEYLSRTFSAGRVAGEPVTVDGVAGAMAAVGRPGRGRAYAAAGVRPDGVVVGVVLDDPVGDDPAGDRDLVRRVAAAITPAARR